MNGEGEKSTGCGKVLCRATVPDSQNRLFPRLASNLCQPHASFLYRTPTSEFGLSTLSFLDI
jgi:hypothetical protein